ncbi:deoxyribonuclease-1-like [Patiria miniata]|uniref:Endonuclease/exonuclease/phosphatase domain-containing protein n=1 Tax=Patiria miniata TaxID=46514 RepID=A0A914BJN3_PATMI|nr:deoxyribonuclease-1-like [Patiria miniata]XP_038076026.1 deoxyribonuclease-1-like [Patiria miniata]XP_038076034.1 deoxyribonuclease-1-like [Patiria miniata]
MMKLAAVCCLLVLTALTTASTSQGTVAPGSSYDGSLLIGAFNIQVFGISKVGKVHVLQTLVKILKRYDLVLIQEIRDSSGTAIRTLLDTLNSEVQDKYEMALSSRLGRTSSKEQYAYFYKPSRLTLLWNYVYDDDSEDKFEREPFVAYFESPTTAMERFAMIGVHIKPSEAVAELDHLVHVYDDYVNKSAGNTNAIIAGDFNADCRYVSKTALKNSLLRSDMRFRWIIPDDADTTVAASDCSYDRIVLAGDDLFDSYQQNRTGAFYFDREYHLDINMAAEVSDHYPVEMFIKGNLDLEYSPDAVQPMLTAYSDSISRSGSFRAVVWMCLLVMGPLIFP